MKVINWIALILMLVSGCCLDSESPIPAITFIACMVWLLYQAVRYGGWPFNHGGHDKY